jgi:hypothetical protein
MFERTGLMVKRFFTVAVLLAGLVCGLARAEVEVVSVEKIWGGVDYCAFTDLVRFGGKWYCVFREGEAHVYGRDGTIRVIVSDDGVKWRSAAVLAEDGVDLRDPKISVTADGRLMIVMGGSIYEGRKLITCQSRVAFSRDGEKWTAGRKVLGEGEWLWRVTWYQGKAWGVAYDTSGGKEWALTLYCSGDGVEYEKVTALRIGGRPNETTLRFLGDGRMVAFVRREGAGANASIGVSSAPYTEWKWHDTGHRVGGPNFVVLGDGKMWAAGRSYPGGARTVLARFGLSEYEPVLTLPSGGDTSYPGLVWREGVLWMSYYSSHEGKASIYLAKIRVE